MKVVGNVLEVKGEKKKIAGVLWNRKAIRERIKTLAKEIANYYGPIFEKDPGHKLLLVGVLNGVIPFFGDLIEALGKVLPSDKFRYDTIAISSYGRGTVSGELQILKDLKDPVNGDHILVVEDIIDMGHTFEFLKAALASKHPASVKVCALINKTARRSIDALPIDFIGFVLRKDQFVVGFGLDWAGLGRTYPDIYYLENA
jgi:hypoxanthine phosphoribosyltransferase